MSEPQDKGDYYSRGSGELATETALLLRKLTQRLELTKSDERLVVVLVGMPGRGKSFIGRKMQNFLQWIGIECKVFNVGRYRRQAADSASADFFDTKNESAAALRQEVARLALEDLLNWIDEPFENGDMENGNKEGDLSSNQVPKGRVGIFDATNSTKERRNWILQQCNDEVKRAGKPTGVVFIESICDDPDLLRENLVTKVTTSPDYEGVPLEEAMEDITNRCKKYEEAYETIENDDVSYIKVFNLSSKLMVNHIYGMLAKTIVPALMSWNIGTRPIYLCRPAADTSGALKWQPTQAKKSRRNNRQTLVLCKKASLDVTGESFKNKLYHFMKKECLEFSERRKNDMVLGKNEPARGSGGGFGDLSSLSKSIFQLDEDEDKDDSESFPCNIATSTTPRACETVAWKCGMPSKIFSNLNPLDKGAFMALSTEEIAKKDPQWYERYLADPFYTRFPGGESQADLIQRLEQIAIYLEQQVEPVLVVSHTNVMQALVAYFRNSPAETCMDIDLPLNTVFKFVPAKGGAWQETKHCLIQKNGRATLESVDEN